MSHIPNKAMHHAHAEPADAGPALTGGTGGGELGGVPDSLMGTGAVRAKALGWALGAAGAGFAVAAVAALLSLRSSSAAAKPKRRQRNGRAKPRKSAPRKAAD